MLSPISDLPIWIKGSEQIVWSDFSKYQLTEDEQSDVNLNTEIRNVSNLKNASSCSFNHRILTITPGTNVDTYVELTINDLWMLRLKIHSVNDAPIIYDQSYTTAEDTSVRIKPSILDPDSDDFTIVIMTPPTHGTVNISGKEMMYTPSLHYFGQDAFSYQVNDGEFNSNPSTVTVNVAPINDVPVLNDITCELVENTDKDIQMDGTDIDSNSLAYSIVSGPNNGTLTKLNEGRYRYEPTKSYSGTDQFTFIAHDGSESSNVAKCTITVKNIDNLPTTSPQTLELYEDTPLRILFQLADIDSESKYIVTSEPSNGRLSRNEFTDSDRSLTYHPNDNYHGTDTFSYKAVNIEHPMIESNVSTITLVIQSINDIPVVTDLPTEISTRINTPIDIPRNATDIDSNELTYDITQQPTNGTVADFIYTPNSDFVGYDILKIQVSDNHQGSVEHTYRINIGDGEDIYNLRINITEDNMITTSGSRAINSAGTAWVEKPRLTFDRYGNGFLVAPGRKIFITKITINDAVHWVCNLFSTKHENIHSAEWFVMEQLIEPFWNGSIRHNISSSRFSYTEYTIEYIDMTDFQNPEISANMVRNYIAETEEEQYAIPTETLATF
jgi:hypothetical protein